MREPRRTGESFSAFIPDDFNPEDFISEAFIPAVFSRTGTRSET
jgi:hypothetical protein